MADLHEPDVGAAYYRSSDPVKNIKIRIQLNRAASATPIPQGFNTDQEQEEGTELSDLKPNPKHAQSDSETITIHWQQKIFSQRELDEYSKDLPAETDKPAYMLQKKYHEEVKALLEKGRPKTRIFTYVDHDTFAVSDENIFSMTTSSTETPTFLAEKMTHLRCRRVGGGQSRHRQNSFVPKVNVVEQKPSEELKEKNHLLSAPLQVMYIMADLSPTQRPVDQRAADDEVILCTVQVDANGVVCIRPDFNKGRKDYIVESGGLSREVFQYTLHHASKQMNRQEQDREMKMYREVYNRHKDFLQACVGQEFELPPPEVLRLMVYGEIESARHFELDNLYIHFFVELPRHWTVEHHQQLSWVTQTCATKVDGRDDVAYFSFPFDFEVFYKDDSIKDENKDLLPHLPLLMIEVLSLDSWNRYRTEGYTYLPIPCKPGVHRETVNCWRPIGKTVASEMRRFFIGGSPELEDPTYAAVPSTYDGQHLSRFAFRTETTGSVTVRLNTVMQSRMFMESKASKRSVGTLLDTLGISAVEQRVTSVMDAFKKARQRMMRARESAHRELQKSGIQSTKEL